jgi:predicted rRNA methylase YqxC with S4 and FtsJ domains
MDEEREAAKAKLEEEGWGTDGISKANGVNDEAEKVFEEYAKAAGLNVDELELTDTKGSDKNREFVYKDAEGKE